MTFVKAIVACIPFSGGAAAHVISGGMAILENADGEDFSVTDSATDPLQHPSTECSRFSVVFISTFQNGAQTT